VKSREQDLGWRCVAGRRFDHGHEVLVHGKSFLAVQVVGTQFAEAVVQSMADSLYLTLALS